MHCPPAAQRSSHTYRIWKVLYRVHVQLTYTSANIIYTLSTLYLHWVLSQYKRVARCARSSATVSDPAATAQKAS